MFEELKNLDVDKDKGYGYVYILLNKDNFIKIGRSSNPYQRIKSLSGSNSGGNKIVRYYISPKMYIHKTIEGIMHRKFKEYRKEGEWFRGNALYVEEVYHSLDELCKRKSFYICDAERKRYFLKCKENKAEYCY